MNQPPTAFPSHIVRNNLLVLLVAGVGAASLALPTEGATAILFGIGFLVQAGVNGLIGLLRLVLGRPDWGAYLLSAVLVLLIGFGACFGMLAGDLVKLDFH